MLFLRPGNTKKRMSYCKLCKKWTQNQWEKVLLGDIFEIFGSNLCQYVSQEEVKSVKTDGEHLMSISDVTQQCFGSFKA